jgi:alpha-1,3/alpha-1,6-mannosyltransferase
MTTKGDLERSRNQLQKQNLVFIHPDLGIGGAERLIIDAAVGLQELGHKVTIFTGHCDPNHCFDEARDGMFTLNYLSNVTLLRLSG